MNEYEWYNKLSDEDLSRCFVTVKFSVIGDEKSRVNSTLVGRLQVEDDKVFICPTKEIKIPIFDNHGETGEWESPTTAITEVTRLWSESDWIRTEVSNLHPGYAIVRGSLINIVNAPGETSVILDDGTIAGYEDIDYALIPRDGVLHETLYFRDINGKLWVNGGHQDWYLMVYHDFPGRLEPELRDPEDIHYLNPVDPIIAKKDL